jgi:hypothetical protein
MPGFGHLLRADARQPAPKHRIWEVFLETDVHHGRQTFFQAMNAGISEEA